MTLIPGTEVAGRRRGGSGHDSNPTAPWSFWRRGPAGGTSSCAPTTGS